MVTDLLNASTIALEYSDKMKDIRLTIFDETNSSQILTLTMHILVQGGAVLALEYSTSQYARYRKCVRICLLNGEEKVATKFFFKYIMNAIDAGK